jgi:hypothetical protein
MIPVNEKLLFRLRELERHIKLNGPQTRIQIEKALQISRAQALRLIRAADTHSPLKVERFYSVEYRHEQYRVTE